MRRLIKNLILRKPIKQPHPEPVEGWPRAGSGPSTRRLRRLLRMRRLIKNLILRKPIKKPHPEMA
jgi:hypothetical protein